MCRMPEFLGLTQFSQRQQVFLLTSMISAYKYKAGWFPSRYVPNISFHTNQSHFTKTKKTLQCGTGIRHFIMHIYLYSCISGFLYLRGNLIS